MCRPRVRRNVASTPRGLPQGSARPGTLSRRTGARAARSRLKSISSY